MVDSKNIKDKNIIGVAPHEEKRKYLSAWKGPLWDGHIHLFPPKLFQAIYRFFREDYGWNLAFTDEHHLLIDYLKRCGVKRASVLVYAHKPNISQDINRWLADLVEVEPWLLPYGCIHPVDDNIKSIACEALDELKFAGIKIHCLVKNVPPDDERFFPVYEALVKRGKTAIIHASTFPLHTGVLGIEYIYNVLRHFPELRLVIPHLGLFELKEYSILMADYPEIYLDTAFVFNNKILPDYYEDIKEIILKYPNRIIYGSDFPFVVNEPSIDIRNLLSMELPSDIYPLIFYENALKQSGI